jgi:glucose-1-phosphate thymidylyltransferase
MKAIIPVAGVGTRLRPHTYTQPKPLIPVAGRAIISSIIEQLVEEGGIHSFVLIVGYLGDKIKNYVEQRYPELDLTFVYQDERQGLGHALWLAKETYEDSEQILIVLGDTIFDGNLKALIASKVSCLGVKKVDDPREFGVVELDEAGQIKKVVEKPRIPKSNLALVGLYKIAAIPEFIASLDYIVEHNVQTAGELQLTDALMEMLNRSVVFLPFKVENWYDCGKKDILLETNAMLLKRLNPKELVEMHSFKNSIIIPPVYLGENCTIENSIIGPHVSIGESAQLKQAIVRDSIIGSYAQIEEVVLHKSIIGSDATVKGFSQSLNIGDDTEIDFS